MTVPPNLILRWESALAVRQALKKTDPAPEDFYTIAILGFPTRNRMDSDSARDHIREQSALKVHGKKLSAAKVDVTTKGDDVVVYIFFPRDERITGKDKDAEFVTQLSGFEIKGKFHPKEMSYQGKLEL